MAKYIVRKTDLTFKRISVEHPNLMISLLNVLLFLYQDQDTNEIEYTSAELFKRFTYLSELIIGCDCFCGTILLDEMKAAEIKSNYNDSLSIDVSTPTIKKSCTSLSNINNLT